GGAPPAPAPPARGRGRRARWPCARRVRRATRNRIPPGTTRNPPIAAGAARGHRRADDAAAADQVYRRCRRAALPTAFPETAGPAEGRGRPGQRQALGGIGEVIEAQGRRGTAPRPSHLAGPSAAPYAGPTQ